MQDRKTLSNQRINRLRIVLVLTSTYLIAEIIGGILTNSLALIADAAHMFTDAAGLGLALFAISFGRRPSTSKKTYGFYRMEILASLTNSVVLILLSVYIMYEAYRRILEPPEIQSFSMIVVAGVGLTVNIISMLLLKGHSHSHSHSHGKEEQHSNKEAKEENLNMQGAYLEVLSDTLGSAGVIIAGLIMFTTKFYLADPIVSIALALFIFPRTWSLLNKSIHILMQGTPSNISYEEVKTAMLQIKGVTGVFDLHIWAITSGMNTLSAHVVVMDPSKSQTILKEINSILENKFNISHSAIQIENYHEVKDD